MLKQKIQNSTNEALKAGDQFLVGTLRLLLASIITKEKEKRYKISKEKPDIKEDILSKESELTDEQVIEIISSEIKKRNDAIVLYEKGNRPELADKERKEIDVLKKYLPEQLSEQEIKNIVKDALTKTGAKEMKDMGKVMAEISPKIKGKADAGSVSKIVKESLIIK